MGLTYVRSEIGDLDLFGKVIRAPNYGPFAPNGLNPALEVAKDLRALFEITALEAAYLDNLFLRTCPQCDGVPDGDRRILHAMCKKYGVYEWKRLRRRRKT